MKVAELIADSVTNEIDFHDEILGFLSNHYANGTEAEDAPARIAAAQDAAQAACGISPNP